MFPEIDLLGAVPLGGDAADKARRAFDFLWATGSGLDAVDEALAPRPASDFEPSVFAGDLFVGELARRAMPVVVEGRARVVDVARLERILGAPPSAPETVARRRAVLRDLLESEARRRVAETFYARVRDLRDALESRGASRDRAADRLRRIEVLHALQQALDALTEGFEGARSALASLATWAREITASAAYGRLRDLLAWESGASTVDLSVRLGADGDVRGVTMLARRELPHPTGEPGWVRALRRFVRMLRGERWDPREVVARLVDEIMDGLADAAVVVLRAGLDLEPHLGCLGMRDRATRAGLATCLPALAPTGAPGLRFEGLHNAFLLADAAAKSDAWPVPCDLVLEDAAPILIVTGPNSGGKTRMLQSLGVAVLLGRGGFLVPAREASFAWAPALFASLTQTSAHDAPEGRLGTELLRVRDVFERARPGSVVLLDELCSGTNPSEAEELVRFVLAELAEVGATTVVTTHLLDVARRLESDPPAKGLAFRRVDLDGDERPTYTFSTGVAASSLARRTAERLGVTREALAKLVRERRPVREDGAASWPDDLRRRG